MNMLSMLGMALAAAIISAPAPAQESRTVGGMVIHMGIVSAIAAKHVDSQHGVHEGGHGSGMEHVVVSLADAQTGARIADADVAIEVRGPRGKPQRKKLLPMITAGVADYSEVFEFGWSGKYAVQVTVRQKGAAKPVRTTFSVSRLI